ncbi:MAG TPA: Imm1 family immunity protein [Thermoguttaceae bacterium]|nr:Imm1 family immunity protein [Thermoguttaceae bacterium]
MKWTLEVGDAATDVSGREELHEQLLEMNSRFSSRPTTAVLNAPDGSCLYVGLGHRLSTLNYIAPGGWPAKHSIGYETEGLYEFLFAGQHSELPAECMIPFESALDAALKFFDTNQLDSTIEWADD